MFLEINELSIRVVIKKAWAYAQAELGGHQIRT